MSWRDRQRHKMIREILGCDDRYASVVIDHMDRQQLNPEWSTIDGLDLKAHLLLVVADMHDKQVKVSQLHSMFTSTDDDPFFRPYRKIKEEENMKQPAERHLGETLDSVAEMSNEEFEKWAESMSNVDEMTPEEYENWVSAIRSRPDLQK